MPLRDFKKITGKLAELNVKTIDIIGGEPTLHKDIIPIIEHAVNRGFGLNLSSNGTNPDTLAEIKQRFRKINVGVSINDMTTFNRLKSFISRHGLFAKTVFSNEIDTNLLKEIILSGTERFYLLYMDVMRKSDIENAVPFSQFIISAQKIFKSPVIHTVYCSGFLPDTASYPALSKTRCPAGTTKLGLMPDGSVYPCNLFFGIKEFRLGNLLHDAFEKIWNHKCLIFFRTFTGNTCPQTVCILHETCHGGCPAHSLIHCGKLNSPEPRCNLRK